MIHFPHLLNNSVINPYQMSSVHQQSSSSSQNTPRDNRCFIARTVTQRAMSCNHRWYICLLHWMIQPLIHLFCPWFVNSHPTLHSWASTNKIAGTQHHHKLIFHSSCHVQRILVVATTVEQGTIGVGKKWLLVITGALIARTVNQISISFHHR